MNYKMEEYTIANKNKKITPIKFKKPLSKKFRKSLLIKF